VQNLSFIVDYFFWHTNTFGFHFTNLLLHAGSAVALFFLLQRILRSVLKPEWLESSFISNLAFFAALLWAVHPVHSAAVDYAHEIPAQLHLWPGGHDSDYWHSHMRQYLAFYARHCA